MLDPILIPELGSRAFLCVCVCVCECMWQMVRVVLRIAIDLFYVIGLGTII